MKRTVGHFITEYVYVPNPKTIKSNTECTRKEKVFTKSSFEVDRELDALLETEAALPYKLTML